MTSKKKQPKSKSETLEEKRERHLNSLGEISKFPFDGQYEETFGLSEEDRDRERREWISKQYAKYGIAASTADIIKVQREKLEGKLEVNEKKKQKEKQKKNSEDQLPFANKPLSVLKAKRKHSGYWIIIGKIVTVSEMYVIEVDATPPATGITTKDAKTIQLEDVKKLDDNERLDVILYDDDITSVIPGEVVEITGNVELQYIVKKKSKEGRGKGNFNKIC
jgi:hypothetical protein